MVNIIPDMDQEEQEHCGMYDPNEDSDFAEEDMYIPPDELTTAQKEKIRELYEQFDVNKTDSLSPKELRQGLQLLGLNPTVSDVKAIIKKHCPPKKKVTYEVWERIFKEELLSKTNQEFDLLEAFKIFDTDNSGTLDKGELKRCLTSMGEKLTDEECDELFDQLDKDKNGTLSFLEASKLLA